jgi:hypothetical protein
MAGKIGDQQPPAGQERRQLAEVPGRTAVPVDQQQRRPVPTLEQPQTRPAMLDPALVEARQQAARIRHVD